MGMSNSAANLIYRACLYRAMLSTCTHTHTHTHTHTGNCPQWVSLLTLQTSCSSCEGLKNGEREREFYLCLNSSLFLWTGFPNYPFHEGFYILKKIEGWIVIRMIYSVSPFHALSPLSLSLGVNGKWLFCSGKADTIFFFSFVRVRPSLRETNGRWWALPHW